MCREVPRWKMRTPLSQFLQDKAGLMKFSFSLAAAWLIVSLLKGIKYSDFLTVADIVIVCFTKQKELLNPSVNFLWREKAKLHPSSDMLKT